MKVITQFLTGYPQPLFVYFRSSQTTAEFYNNKLVEIYYDLVSGPGITRGLAISTRTGLLPNMPNFTNFSQSTPNKMRLKLLFKIQLSYHTNDRYMLFKYSAIKQSADGYLISVTQNN